METTKKQLECKESDRVPVIRLPPQRRLRFLVISIHQINGRYEKRKATRKLNLTKKTIQYKVTHKSVRTLDG